jgi:hypothetical protein
MYEENVVHTLYKKLLTFYPRSFREQLGESMEQTFNDFYRERQAKLGRFGFVLWTFVDTAIGIAMEHVLSITKGSTMKTTLAYPRSAALLSAILLSVAFIVAPFIYLVGNLRDAMGPLSYAVADFLYGPVWAASLVSIVTGSAGCCPRSRDNGSCRLYSICQSALSSDSPRAASGELVGCPHSVDYPRSGPDERRMAFPGMGPHTDRISRLDIAPTSSSIVHTLFGGWNYIDVRLCAFR